MLADNISINSPTETPTPRVFNRRVEEQNKTTYHDTDSHERDSRDILQVYRTYGKRNGASRGADKVTIKLTRDLSVANATGDGNLVLPLIGNASFSIPLGTDDSELTILRTKLANAIIGTDLGVPLTVDLTI